MLVADVLVGDVLACVVIASLGVLVADVLVGIFGNFVVVVSSQLHSRKCIVLPSYLMLHSLEPVGGSPLGNVQFVVSPCLVSSKLVHISEETQIHTASLYICLLYIPAAIPPSVISRNSAIKTVFFILRASLRTITMFC